MCEEISMVPRVYDSWSYVFLWLGDFKHNKHCLYRGAPLSPLMAILLCSSPPFPMLA